MAPNKRQAIISAKADPIDWRIYEELGEDELVELWHDEMEYRIETYLRCFVLTPGEIVNT